MKRLGILVLMLAVGFGISGTFVFGDEKELMEAMMKAGTPGDAHKVLDTFTGSWDLVVTMWMDPSKPPDEAKATSEVRWALGGRFLEEKVVGNFGGAPFEGRSTTGYDNLRKAYTSVWIDNMSTGVMHAQGTYDSASKTFTYHREDVDPVTKKPYKARDVIHVISKDRIETDMFKIVEGRDVKTMRIVYSRKK